MAQERDVLDVRVRELEAAWSNDRTERPTPPAAEKGVAGQSVRLHRDRVNAFGNSFQWRECGGVHDPRPQDCPHMEHRDAILLAKEENSG